MKIDICLMSCDDNPLYLDFWSTVSKVWKVRFNITPILIYFGDKLLNKEFGQVVYQSPIKNTPLDIQCLWARYYYTSKFLDKTCIISDIDMFPISRFYFQKQIEHLDSYSYVHLYSNSGREMLPSCYHIALGKTFKDFLELPDTFEESIQKITEFGKDVYRESSSYWFVDEIYATHLLKAKDIIGLNRPDNSRLDRTNWIQPTNKSDLEKYVDSHSVRPYKDYKLNIDTLVDLLCMP